MCDLLGVTRSTFYAWKKRRGLLNSYAKHRQELSARVVEIFHSQRQCGVRTIAGRLRAEGVTVSDRLVRRIMDEHGLATSRTRSFRITTIREPGAGRDITDHLTQQFHAEHYLPGEHLVGDITYLKAGTTWLYLATVIDLSTRMILGYAVADHMRCDLISTALTKARRNGAKAGAVFHSDRGTQYTSEQFRTLCKAWDITQSMGRVGTCYDNAVAESFFSRLKCENYRLARPSTQLDARWNVHSWIRYYNHERYHGSIGYATPAEAWNSKQATKKKQAA